MDSSVCTSWLEIDLGALKNNIHLLQEMTKKQVMAVVKANAYGHGMLEIVKTAYQAGVQWFGVARVEEALQAVEAAPQASVLVMGYTPPEMIGEAVKRNINFTVYDFETASMYSRLAGEIGEQASVHIKFDTGMGRLGYNLPDVVVFARKVMEMPHLALKGVFTHFACADEPGKETTSKQIRQFNNILSALRQNGINPSLVHACNTAGTFNFPEAHYDMVRTGIGIYGISPSSQTPLPEGFQSVLTFKSRLTSVKELPARHGVSYGHHYFTPAAQRIGVVGVGYADGFRRKLNSSVLVQGMKTPVVGMVAMDQSMVVLDNIRAAKIGDEVVIFGKQGAEQIRVEDLAAEWGTIGYEVICGMSARLPRIYLD